MYISKPRELAQLESKIRNHKETLKKYEQNPPQLPHEHEAVKFAQQQIEELTHRHNSVMTND